MELCFLYYCMYPSLSVPGITSALVLAWMGLLSFSQLRVGGGKPVASQESDTKLLTTTVKVSGFGPMIVGGTNKEKETETFKVPVSEIS